MFEHVFNGAWAQMPKVFKKQLGQAPSSFKGSLEIEMGFIFRLFSPLMRFFNLLIPFSGEFAAKVNFFQENENFIFDRHLIINNQPYIFKSRLIFLTENLIEERLPLSISWLARYSYDENIITMQHVGYKFLGLILPLELIFGKGDAKQWAISDNKFQMEMTIKHPLFGFIYGYKGEFEALERIPFP